MHHLLSYLADRSYPAPRPLGIDDRGREVLSFIPGQSVHPDNLTAIETVGAVRRAGKLIADCHRAQAGFVSPSDAAWRTEGRDPSGSSEVVAHNDLAPWNLIVGPTGWVFIDWDLAAPGRRVWDLAWALHTFAGLWPDASLAADETARRITAFCDGAEVAHRDRPHLLDVVVERTQHHAPLLRTKAQHGDPVYQRLGSEGHLEVWEQASAHVEANVERWSKLMQA